MMPLMVERIRLTFDISDRARRALNMAAARLNLTVGEVVERLADGTLSPVLAELEMADAAISEGQPATRPRRGRKPRG